MGPEGRQRAQGLLNTAGSDGRSMFNRLRSRPCGRPVCLVHAARMRACDDLAEMLCKRVASIVKKARTELEEIRLRQRAVSERLIGTYRTVLEHLDPDGEAVSHEPGLGSARAVAAVEEAGGFASWPPRAGSSPPASSARCRRTCAATSAGSARTPPTTSPASQRHSTLSSRKSTSQPQHWPPPDGAGRGAGLLSVLRRSSGGRPAWRRCRRRAGRRRTRRGRSRSRCRWAAGTEGRGSYSRSR